MAAHRYWRIYITAVNYKSDGSTGFREIELRESLGGADVTGSGTASADSSFGSTWSADKAVDDNTSTEWVSGVGGVPHWWKYDFGAGNEKDIVELAFVPRPAAAVGQAPIDFELQWSDDDSAWTTLYKVKGHYSNPNVTTLNLINAHFGVLAETADAGEAWRIKMTATGGGGVYSVQEVEMRATSGGATLCVGGEASASGFYDGSGFYANATLAFNGSGTGFNNCFSTNGTTAGSSGAAENYIAYRFPSSVVVGEYTLRARTDSNADQAPTAFTLERWSGTAWEVVDTRSGLSWSLGETKTFLLDYAGTGQVQTSDAVGAVASPSGTTLPMAMDRGYLGRPFNDVLPPWFQSANRRDQGYLGRPFGELEFVATTVNATVETAQVQTAAAAGNMVLTGTVETGQVQTADAAAASFNEGEFISGTGQVQTSDAVGTTSIAATVETGQVQSANAAGAVSTVGTVETGQVQSAAATVVATDVWQVLDTDSVGHYNVSRQATLASNAMDVEAGDMVLVFATWGTGVAVDPSETCTLADTGGNTWHALDVIEARTGSNPANYCRGRWFVCYNINVGVVGNVFTMTLRNLDGTVTDGEQYRSLFVMRVDPPAGVTPVLHLYEDKDSRTTGASVQAPAASITRGGFVAVGQVNRVASDGDGSITGGYTLLARPNTTGTSRIGAVAYQSGVTGLQQPTFTGSSSAVERAVAILAFSAAQDASGVEATVSSGQVQATNANETAGAWWHRDYASYESPSLSVPSWDLNPVRVEDGDHVVVQFATSVFTAGPIDTITVTDSAGNTYSVAPGAVYDDPAEWNQRLYTFYCLNATGHGRNVLTVAIDTDGAGGMAPSINAAVNVFRHTGGGLVAYDTGVGTVNASSATSVTAPAIDTAAAGVLVGFAYQNSVDTSWQVPTYQFSPAWETEERPSGRIASGHKETTGALTGHAAAFTSGSSTRRFLVVAAFSAIEGGVDAVVETGQVQSAFAGVMGLGWSFEAGTGQVQTSDAVGSVTSVTYVALTGVQAAGEAGTLGVATAQPLTGAQAAGAVGSVRGDRRRPVSGVQAAGAVGSIPSAPRTVATTGVQAVGAAGNVATSRTKALTGVAGTGQVATIAAVLKPPLTGVQAAGATGTLIPPRSIAGVAATGHVGTVRPRISKALTGVQGEGQVGFVATVGVTRLSGVSSTGQVGSVSSSRVRQLSGVTGATTVGSVLPSQGALGVAASGAVGSVGIRRTIALTGVQANTAVGRVGNRVPVNSDAVFVSTPTLEVTTSAVYADVFIVSSAVTVLVATKDDQVLV